MVVVLTNHATPSMYAGLHLGVIGGGNMARAILSGLLRNGMDPTQVTVVEPHAGARARLNEELGISADIEPSATLEGCSAILWAVKPQAFAEACAPVLRHLAAPLHVSVIAGLRTETLRSYVGSERIVRCMPNTPAAVGAGITGAIAGGQVSNSDRQLADALITPTGQIIWFDSDADLDRVTAISGSGPAYVFYFLEAVIDAGVSIGLAREVARQLAIATFVGTGALARSSTEEISELRSQVTSKGGTTAAAIDALDAAGVQNAIREAVKSAHNRAQQLSAHILERDASGKRRIVLAAIAGGA